MTMRSVWASALLVVASALPAAAEIVDPWETTIPKLAAAADAVERSADGAVFKKDGKVIGGERGTIAGDAAARAFLDAAVELAGGPADAWHRCLANELRGIL